MTQSVERTAQVGYTRSRGLLPAVGRAGVEIALIGALYAFYCVTRTFASTAFAPARGHALDILTFEKTWRLNVESWLNDRFFQYDWLGVFGSYWYATLHYAVTLVVLIWLYRRNPLQYLTARRALVLASLAGLTFYLLMPTAPPRLVDGGFHDILSLHSNIGWWSENGSAPKGLGNVTNELAAFPSLHAGWALWVAIVLVRAGVAKWVQALGFVYAATMAIVIVGTANHWVLDVIVGWLVVLVSFGVTIAWERKGPMHDGHHDDHLVTADT